MGSLNIDMIRDYLVEVGCKIEYPILVNAFKKHLYNPDPNIQGKIRTQFKDYVNRLASVSLENNMKFINLRPEFVPQHLRVQKDSGNHQHTHLSHRESPPIQALEQHYPATGVTNQLPQSLNQQQIRFQSQPDVQQSTTQKNVMQSAPQDSKNLSAVPMTQQMPPPRPPPRRHQSNASLFKQPARMIADNGKKSQNISLNSSNGSKKNLTGSVKEHALRLNSNNTSFSSLSLATSPSSDLHSNFHSQQQLHMPRRYDSLKESTNRLSRDSAAFVSGLSTSGISAVKLQRNGSYLTARSRSSHRGEDESDSSSLQPTIDPLKRKWAIEACSCNYNGLLTLLREDPKLASYKDIVNGYTALHWAAKFGNLDIIKLIAGTHGVTANIKSSAGQTPLHVAYLFNRLDAARLLLESYRANPDIRDHKGKRPMQYYQGTGNKSVKGVNCTSDYNNSCVTTA